jgi:peptidoglycan hydrolase CwlO-like protein
MSTATADWLLQLALLLALAAALPVAIRLERAFAALRRDRAALSESTEGFGAATRSAEAAVARLRTSAETAGRSMAEAATRAESLRDDLRYLTERAEALADRLEALVRAARPLAGPLAGSVGGAAAVSAPQPEPPRATASVTAETMTADPVPPASRAERDLLRALRGGAAVR